MSKVFDGRYTAKTDEPFVVFLIGMRINKWRRFDKWVPVGAAMEHVPALGRRETARLRLEANQGRCQDRPWL